MKTVSIRSKKYGICHITQASKAPSDNRCPDGKYWVSPHARKRTDKNGKVYTQSVKGYCCSYHDHFAQLAEEEQMQLDLLFLALTVYGETAMENIASKKAVAWVIRNRCNISNIPKKYREIVLKRKQFSCWLKSDPNYKRMQRPGKHDPIDQRSWQECKFVRGGTQ